MLVSKSQMSLLTLLSARRGNGILITDINTITYASLYRRGAVELFKNRVKLTILGKEIYKWNTDHKIQSWKKDLAAARDAKASKKPRTRKIHKRGSVDHVYH